MFPHLIDDFLRLRNNFMGPQNAWMMDVIVLILYLMVSDSNSHLFFPTSNVCRCEFSVVFSALLFCFTIAMKCIYQVSNGWAQPLWSCVTFGCEWGYQYLQVRVFGCFLCSLFYFALVKLRNVSTKFQMPALSRCGVVSPLVVNGGIIIWRCEFSVVLFDCFFILFYYSYAMYLLSFEWLRSAIVELCHIWL